MKLNSPGAQKKKKKKQLNSHAEKCLGPVHTKTHTKHLVSNLVKKGINGPTVILLFSPPRHISQEPPGHPNHAEL